MRYTYSYFIQSSFKHFFLQNNVYSIKMGRFWVISQNMWNVRAIEIKKSTGNKTVTYSHLTYPLRASWHIRPCCNGSTISVSAFCYWFAQQIHPSFDRINLVDLPQCWFWSVCFFFHSRCHFFTVVHDLVFYNYGQSSNITF